MYTWRTTRRPKVSNGWRKVDIVIFEGFDGVEILLVVTLYDTILGKGFMIQFR